MRCRQSHRKSCLRRGAVLVALLICLLIVLMISAAAVQVLVMQNRVTRAESHQIQAAWLADSALDRAIARMAKDAKYDGETWEVLLDDGIDSNGGVAVIAVEAAEAPSNRRIISVEARWPDVPVYYVMEQRELIIDLTDPGES